MLRIVAFAAALGALAIVPQAASAKTLEQSDLQRFVGLRSPAVSPDGKRALVVVERVNWDEDRYDTDLVLVNLSDGQSRTLTYHRRGVSDPSFSPSGDAIAFLADEGSSDDATTQLFVMRLDGGDARPVTKEKDGVQQYVWRPDGRAFAYVASEPKPERKGANKYRDSFVFTTEPITARQAPRPARLFTINTDGRDRRQLTSGSSSVATGEGQSSVSWSPDSKMIAFTLVPNAILNDQSASRIALVSVRDKAVRLLTKHSAWESLPLFSPDGKHISYVYSTGDPQVSLTQVYVTSPEGGEGRAPSLPFDREVQDVSWLPDSSGILFRSPDATDVALVRAPLEGTLHREPMPDAIEYTSGLHNAFTKDGAFVFVGSTTKSAPELYVRSASGTIRRLTHYNDWVRERDLASSETITFPTTLGITGDAVLYMPPGFQASRKYPLVTYIHGGPTSASTRSFDFEAQVMAAHGWLVLRPNYRGSDNLGLTYQRGVLYDPEEGPGKDIVAAIDVLRSRGIVDERRIATSGWSYGGIMTAWLISKYHFWAAAVSGASVNDWITDYGTADDSLADRDLLHGSPFLPGNAEEWRRASAITYARDVTTPVLILSDVGDNRDPFATSSMYWRALRDNGKDATLRVWPVNGHFPGDPVRGSDVYHYWIDYIARHFR